MTFTLTAVWTFVGVLASAFLAMPMVSQGPPAGDAVVLGHVVDADSGRPIGGVIVTITGGASGPPPGGFIPAGLTTASALTDAQGRFVFRRLPKGTFSLTTAIGGSGFSVGGFIASGAAPQIGPYLNGGYGQRRPNGPMLMLELAEDERVLDPVIRLWRGASIDGIVRDEAGEPLVGLVVAGARVSADGRLLTGPTTRTDDRGAYHLSTLVPGTYVVVVPQTQTLLPSSTIDAVFAGDQPNAQLQAQIVANGAPAPTANAMALGGVSLIPPAYYSVVGNNLAPRIQGGETYAYPSTFVPGTVSFNQAERLTVRSGEERSGADIVLRPLRTVAVSGTVVSDGGAVPNFGVHLLPAESGSGESLLEVATTATDGHGAFLFPMVPAGQYTIVAVKDPPSPSVQAAAGSGGLPVGLFGSVAVSVGDRSVGGLSVMIRPGVQVGGKVEFKGSSPLPSDRIRQAGISLVRTPPLFRLAGPSPGTRMSLTGEFTIAGVPPGRYVLRTPEIFAGWALESVRVGGRDLTDLPFDVRAEDLTGIIVTLTDRPAELSGSVRTASGDPDPNASVFLFPVDRSRWPDGRVMNRAFRTARIQPTGSFRVTNLISGEYFVAAAVDEAAVEWPDVAFLQRLAAGATRLRVEPGQLQTMSLTTAPFR